MAFPKRLQLRFWSTDRELEYAFDVDPNRVSQDAIDLMKIGVLAMIDSLESEYPTKTFEAYCESILTSNEEKFYPAP